MRQRSRAGGKSAKSQRRKTTMPEHLNASKAVRRGDPSVADLQGRLERQAQELIEARELQAATAEVLRVISISPHDIQPVFDTIAENAARICQGRFAFVVRFDNKLCRFGACHGLTPGGLEAFRRVLPRPAGEETAALAADKKLAFKVELAPELPPGHGDGRRLTQVLINLVGNAIKFTDAGEVAIKAEANNGSFFVSVRDTGPGISAADQAKLFQEFQQADNAITRKKGGTGLGLAISKRIIEMHGGRIWVESQPGRGSTFAFTLPVHVEQQVEPA
jgi:signal transduction histidine kinase